MLEDGMLLRGDDAGWVSEDHVSTEAYPLALPGLALYRVPTAGAPCAARRTYTARALASDSATSALPVGTAYQHCREIAREVARTFYYGSLFLPDAKRRAAWALYAFCRVADDIADDPERYDDPLGQLSQWREALIETYAGRPRGPVMRAWADMLARYPVPLEPALDLIAGVEMDLRGTSFTTFEELRVYCYRVAGTVGLLMAPVLGYEDEAALAYAVDLGIGMQLTNILRDIGEDARQQRVYLPAEELVAFGYRHEDLMRGVINPAFLNLMEYQIARAEEFYERGMRGVELLSADSRMAIALSGSLYRGILERIRRNRYDVFTRRAHVPFAGKLAVLPGTWLRLHGIVR